MRPHCIASCIVFGTKLHVGAFIIEFPCLALVMQANIQDPPQPFFQRGSKDWYYHLNTLREIAEHPVRRSDEKVTSDGVVLRRSEMENSGMFKKTSDDGPY